MKLLLTNDDGIEAEGLAALEQAARRFGEVTVTAPDRCWSCGGHGVTTDDVLSYAAHDANRHRIGGTPADCVRLALARIKPDADWVLAGINHGGNLGIDVYHSGTVAAAREAVFHGRRAIAISQYHRRSQPIDWRRSARWATEMLRRLFELPYEPGTLWNVNFPLIEPGASDPEIVFCPLELGPLPLSFREEENGWRYDGLYHERVRGHGTDVDLCFAGRITVTQLRLA